MLWCLSEPTLSEMLSDPIVRAVMAADRVAPEELVSTLSKVNGSGTSQRRSSHHGKRS